MEEFVDLSKTVSQNIVTNSLQAQLRDQKFYLKKINKLIILQLILLVVFYIIFFIPKQYNYHPQSTVPCVVGYYNPTTKNCEDVKTSQNLEIKAGTEEARVYADSLTYKVNVIRNLTIIEEIILLINLTLICILISELFKCGKYLSKLKFFFIIILIVLSATTILPFLFTYFL